MRPYRKTSKLPPKCTRDKKRFRNVKLPAKILIHVMINMDYAGMLHNRWLNANYLCRSWNQSQTAFIDVAYQQNWGKRSKIIDSLAIKEGFACSKILLIL
ncbi:hypothetical protein NPIL_468331 [Nephila pilipes]|uniref:F-box domain-containing protein n=1 Tax=Nephila pilipes TaxID=299642 RepID=A0A8X6UDP0_NEPPI|nr:hypothetical protein NPIL_468331 [Nephila pilipes]